MELIGDLMELVNNCDAVQKQDTSKLPTALETVNLLAELGFTTAVNKVKGKINPILKKAEIAAGGYIEITPTKIYEFLNKKAAAYNNEHPKLKKKQDVSSISGAGIAATYGSLYTSMTTESYLGRNYLAGQQQSAFNALSLQRIHNIGNFGVPLYTDTMLQGRAGEMFEACTNDSSSTAQGTIGRFRWTEVPIEHYTGVPPINVLKKFKDEIVKKVFDFFTIASVNAVRDPLLLGRIDGSDSRFYVAQWGDDISLDDLI